MSCREEEAARGGRRKGREKKTQSTIQPCHSDLMQQLEGVCFGFSFPPSAVALKHLHVELLSPFYLLFFVAARSADRR